MDYGEPLPCRKCELPGGRLNCRHCGTLTEWAERLGCWWAELSTAVLTVLLNIDSLVTFAFEPGGREWLRRQQLIAAIVSVGISSSVVFKLCSAGLSRKYKLIGGACIIGQLAVVAL